MKLDRIGIGLAKLMLCVPLAACNATGAEQLLAGFEAAGGRTMIHGDAARGYGFVAPMVRQIAADARQAERRRQAEIAAAQERRRVAELQKTKAGRAQLAREEAERRRKREEQNRLVAGAILLMAGGGGGGGGGGVQSGGDDYYYRTQPSSPAPVYVPPPPTSGLYGNCHGGAAYGC